MIISEIFRLYLGLIGGLLTVVGLILFVLSKAFHKDVSSIWNIYRGWLIMVPIFLIFVLLGRVVFIIGVLGLSIFSFIEFSQATQLNRSRWITYMVYIGIISVAVLALIRNPPTGFFGAYGMFMALPVYVIGLIVIVPILQNQHQGQLQAISLGVMGFIYFGWMFGHLSFLVDSSYADNYVLFIVFAVQIADISAYNFGKLFGRHKLRSNISPNKTLEGGIGALIVSLCLPWLFRATFPEFGPLQLVLTGLIVGVGSQLGDLTISLIKRDMGIKDMGTLIPGHGGVLDRIDSLIIAVPLFFHMTRYFGALYP
ncbi:MAG: phosphatidate cytidylyltransferase [Anaerolineales bacterium]|nr:phosphatidate cytidylyltransferase [Anaerolineales bacterium]